MADVVNHPDHYMQAAAMLEPIDVLANAPFALGNALKYMLRAGHKGSKSDELIDWKKAEKYLEWVRERYLVHPEPYDAFLKHHGLYLAKFKALAGVNLSSGFYPMLGDLEVKVEKGIESASMLRWSHNGKGVCTDPKR